MRKIILLLIALLMAVLSATAQVAINTDGSAADASAILDVSSTTKGVLIPRMTRAQIEAMSSPANGLMVFNTDDNRFYIYISAKSIWREVDFAAGTVVPPADYTISCSNTIVSGDYIEGSALNAGDTVILDANVTTTGDWSITTNTTNGYSFSGGGNFTTTGTQQVKLTGSGMPAAGQTDSFTATASNGGGTCTFTVKVIGTVTGANDRIWMDRNLGATEVATAIDDTNAYGDLYQWGRAAEGHEKRNSSTTSTLATTAVPNAGNVWDGEFITPSSSPYDWLSPQDNNLWQGVDGTNNPCPAGFRLPTETEWSTEYTSWATQDDAGAYGSSLKLPDSGSRNYWNADLVELGTAGNYWSSTVSSSSVQILFYDNSTAIIESAYRGYGVSVRCIKD